MYGGLPNDYNCWPEVKSPSPKYRQLPWWPGIHAVQSHAINHMIRKAQRLGIKLITTGSVESK